MKTFFVALFVMVIILAVGIATGAAIQASLDKQDAVKAGAAYYSVDKWIFGGVSRDSQGA